MKYLAILALTVTIASCAPERLRRYLDFGWGHDGVVYYDDYGHNGVSISGPVAPATKIIGPVQPPVSVVGPAAGSATIVGPSAGDAIIAGPSGTIISSSLGHGHALVYPYGPLGFHGYW
ncbi:uncharacterized protein LOC105697536 [Orussus abietinus]|uniref:uncharacterized protein LOC105697536 n=1 Tax=Orussus abietinus TaxID=222816 RepID=UPI000625EDF3|nr:uncharacterized protein LOC105697536 [Orussus abietinus]